MRFVPALVAVALAAPFTSAQTTTWNGANATWGTAGNWNNGLPNSASYTAVINSGTVTLDAAYSVGGFTFGGGILTGSTQSLSLASALTWTGGRVETTLNAGAGGTLSTGTLVNAGQVNLNAGTFTWSGGNLWTDAAAATWTLAAGATMTDTQAGSHNFWYNAASGGTFTIAGTLTKTGAGELAWNSGVNVGVSSGGLVDVQNGVLRMTATSQTIAGELRTAAAGTARFVSTTALNAGAALTGDGAFELISGTTTVNAAVAASRFTLAGGTQAGANALTVSGPFAFTSGRVNGGLVANATASFTGTDTKVVAGVLTLHGATTWGGGNLWTDAANATITVGAAGTLTDTQAGAHNLWYNAVIGGTFRVDGTFVKTGSGTLDANNGITVLVASGGTFDVQNGTANFNGTLSNLAAGTLTNGTWRVSNATLKYPSNVTTIAANTSVELNGTGTSAQLATLATVNGTLKVTGGKSYTPAATVSLTNGTVEVGAGSTLTTNLNYTGGTFRGSGTVAGHVAFSGTGNSVTPGTSPGTLTVTGNVTMNSGTTFTVELNGTSAGTQYDQLVVGGNVTLANAVLAGSTGYTPSAGDRLFVVVNNGANPVSGTFNGLADGQTVDLGAYRWRISYFGDFGTSATTGGNDVVLHDVTPVPEPATLGLVAVAVGVALRVRRRPRPAPASVGA